MLWIYFAFMRPPIFSRRNFRTYLRTIYQLILKGSDEELRAIADELCNSARSVIQYSETVSDRALRMKNSDAENSGIESLAYELILLISHKRLCGHIVASSIDTAAAFFDEMTKLQKYDLPIGQFSRNIIAEALNNTDSFLFHESNSRDAGLIGHLKPISKAIFGDSTLVTRLALNGDTPLDVDYRIVEGWNAQQLRAYARCVLIFTEDYLKKHSWYDPSPALYRAFGNIKASSDDLYRLNDAREPYSSDISGRLSESVACPVAPGYFGH